MPFYEYECPHCGYHDEVLQKISDKPLKKCPSCGKNGLKKLMSAPVFRLKGSGWYETDFKNKSETKRNLVERAGSESTETATTKSTDTAAKEAAGKAVDAAKSGDPKEKAAKPKPASARPSSVGRTSKARSRAKAAG